jgi:hypothetical protein
MRNYLATEVTESTEIQGPKIEMTETEEMQGRAAARPFLKLVFRSFEFVSNFVLRNSDLKDKSG